MEIHWTEHLVSIKDLDYFPPYASKIAELEIENLMKSIKKNGYHSRIIVNHKNYVLDGHKRAEALKRLKYEIIHVLKPTVDTTDEQEENIIHGGNYIE